MSWVRIFVAALLLALATVPAPAAPVTIPFTVAPADFIRMRVEYRHSDVLSGVALPDVLLRYAVRITVETANATGITVLIHNESMDLTVDSERGPTPPDLDSVMLLAIDRTVAQVELTPSGLPVRVTNWALLRDVIADRARARARTNPRLATAVEAYLARLDAGNAVYLFAQPLAFAAVGRTVAFDPQDATIVTRERLALPSFLPSTASAWAFTLADNPPSPDAVTVTWQGAPDRSSLTPVLVPIAAEISALAPDAGVDIGTLVQGSTIRQDFRSDYRRDDGWIIDLAGTLTLTAGPLSRRVTIEVKAEP